MERANLLLLPLRCVGVGRYDSTSLSQLQPILAPAWIDICGDVVCGQGV